MTSVLELIGLLISIPSFLHFLCILYNYAVSHCTAFRQHRRALNQAESAFITLETQFHALHHELQTYLLVLSQSDYPITLLPAVDHQLISNFIERYLPHLTETKATCQSRGLITNIRYARRIHRQSEELEKLAIHLTFQIQTMKTCCVLLQFIPLDSDAAMKLISAFNAAGTSCLRHIERHAANLPVQVAPLPPHPIVIDLGHMQLGNLFHRRL